MRKILAFFLAIFLFACSNFDVREEELENLQITLDPSDPNLFFVCIHPLPKKIDDESEIKNSPGSIDLDY